MNATPYQFLPPLSDEEREALRESVSTFGVLQAVITDEAGAIIDGHHRADVADELGIEYNTVVLPGLTEEQKVEQALALNLGRRHLTAEQKQHLVSDLKQRGLSVRWISEKTGIPKSTVHRLAGVPSGTPGYVTGKDGKRYQARRIHTLSHAEVEVIEMSIDWNMGEVFVALAEVFWITESKDGSGRRRGAEVIDRWIEGASDTWAHQPELLDTLPVWRSNFESWLEVIADDFHDEEIHRLIAEAPDLAAQYRGMWQAMMKRKREERRHIVIPATIEEAADVLEDLDRVERAADRIVPALKDNPVPSFTVNIGEPAP